MRSVTAVMAAAVGRLSRQAWVIRAMTKMAAIPLASPDGSSRLSVS